MSSGLDAIRAQILVSLGMEGEGVLATAEEQMRRVAAMIEEISNQNKAGQLTGQAYLDEMRNIVKVYNDLERAARGAIQAQKDMTNGTKEQIQAETELSRIRQNLLNKENAQAMSAHAEKVRLWEDEKQAQAELVAVRDRIGKQAIAQDKAEHDARVQAWQDQQKLLAEEKQAEADLATARAAIGKQETARVNAEHDAKVQAWQDQADKQARIEKEDVDRAAQLLKQQQDARKLDAEVNKVIHAQAQADDAALTRQIEASVNPRMAASDKYRQSVQDATEATKRAKQAEDELTAAIEKHRLAKREAEAFSNVMGISGNSTSYPQSEYVDLLEKQTQAESDLVGAQLKHAASQGQVDDATKKAAVSFTAMQKGTTDSASSTMAWTRAVYFAAQGVEDLQYGFNAVVNNIPMVAMSIAQGLGKSAEAAMGFGAAISLVAVGINSVVIPAFKNFVDTHEDVKVFFDELGKQLNPFHVDTYSSALDRMTERIKELENKKVKISVDLDELQRLNKEVDDVRKATEAANAILNHQTAIEAQMGKNIATDLETEEGRKGFDAGRETSARMAVKNSQQVREKRAQIAAEEQAAQRAQEALDTAQTDEQYQIALGMLQSHQKRIEQFKKDVGVIETEVAEGERNRFDLDMNQARTAVGSDQTNAQKRALANLRAAGQGGLADKIAGDIASGQKGLGTKQEVSNDEADTMFDELDASNSRAATARKARIAKEKSRATELATAFQDRFTDKILAGVIPTIEDVIKELEQVTTAEEAAKLAPRVLAKVKATIEASLVKEMAANPGLDAPGAAANITIQRSNQQADKARREEAGDLRRAGETPAQHAARLAQAKTDREAQKAAKEAEKVQKEQEGRIDKTGVQEQAFALFDQIAMMPKGKDRNQANAQADKMIAMMVQQMSMQDASINPVQAQSMAQNAPEYFRRLFGNQLAKQQALLGGQGAGGRGRGMRSVGVGPDDGNDNVAEVLGDGLAGSNNLGATTVQSQELIVSILATHRQQIQRLTQRARTVNNQLIDFRQNNQNWTP